MNGLLYTNEHLSCINYQHDNQAAIVAQEIENGLPMQLFCTVNTVIIVTKNTIMITSDQITETTVNEWFMFFLPAGSNAEISAGGGTAEILQVRFFEKIAFCDSYSIEDLAEVKRNKGNGSSLQTALYVHINEIMTGYISLLKDCHKAGLHCYNFNKLKVEEFLFMLRAFYSKEDLAAFFYNAVNTESQFTDTVMTNHLSCRSVAELAQKAGYSVSGFEKKFKRIFHESPYRWMTRQRQRYIYHYIRNSPVTISQISDDLGFGSPSIFNDYVKKNFKKTPGQLRTEGIKE